MGFLSGLFGGGGSRASTSTTTTNTNDQSTRITTGDIGLTGSDAVALAQTIGDTTIRAGSLYVGALTMRDSYQPLGVSSVPVSSPPVSAVPASVPATNNTPLLIGGVAVVLLLVFIK